MGKVLWVIRFVMWVLLVVPTGIFALLWRIDYCVIKDVNQMKCE